MEAANGFAGRFGAVGHGHHDLLGPSRAGPVDQIQVAGKQLDLGLIEGDAAAVVDGDPVDQAGLAAVAGQFEHIVAAPAQAGGEIAESYRLAAFGRLLQFQSQGRPLAQIVRHLVVDDAVAAVGVEGFDAAVFHAQDHASVDGEDACFLPFQGLAAVAGATRDAHGAADMLLQQGLRRQQVEIVVLLAHRESVDGQGLRQDLLRHIHQRDAGTARRQIEFALFAHQGAARVVHGQRQPGLLLGAGSVFSGQQVVGQQQQQAGDEGPGGSHGGSPCGSVFRPWRSEYGCRH